MAAFAAHVFGWAHSLHKILHSSFQYEAAQVSSAALFTTYNPRFLTKIIPNPTFWSFQGTQQHRLAKLAELSVMITAQDHPINSLSSLFSLVQQSHTDGDHGLARRYFLMAAF